MNLVRYNPAMPFELRFALRYLFSKRGGLARMTTISALLGIAFGVACLILVQAIYNGFRSGIEETLLGQTAHVTVTTETNTGASTEMVSAALKQDSNVKRVEPVLFNSSVVSKNGRTAYGLMRVGFGKEEDGRGVVIGKELAKRLGAEKGTKIGALFETPKGEVIEAELVIDGLVETGLYEYDSQLIRMSSEEFSQLSEGETVLPNAYIVTLHDPFKLETTTGNLRHLAGPAFEVSDWRSVNQPLFAALSFERRIAFLVFAIMVALAALGIAAALALLVNERRIDVAVLRTCGIRSASLLRIFFIEGLLIGISGVAGGIVLGYICCAAANWIGLVSIPGQFPTTKPEKARTIGPLKFAPWERMSLVEITFKASPNTVETSNKVGNTEKSRACRVYSTISTIRRLNTRLNDISTSSRERRDGNDHHHDHEYNTGSDENVTALTEQR